MVVTVGTMEAEVGVTLVEAVRLVGAMMEGRGESTVDGINIVVMRAQRIEREEAEILGQRSRTHITQGAVLGPRKNREEISLGATVFLLLSVSCFAHCV